MPLRSLFPLLAVFCVLCGTTAIASDTPTRVTIAFAAEHEGGLHVVEASSGKISELNVGMLDVRDLAYNKAKEVMAFSAAKTHGRSQSLYLLSLPQKKKTRIFDGQAHGYALYRPVFSPSGQYVYALNYSEGIFRYSLQQRHWERVAISGKNGVNPQGLSFSLSGTKVAVSHGRFKGFLIASVTRDGFHIEREILNDFDSCTSPQWIGDDTIVFAGRKQPGLQYLWKVNLGTGQLDQLTASPIGARDFLSLSNDQKTVVFTATETSQPLEWRLWLLALDGSQPTQLTKGGQLSSHLFPVWLN